MSIDIPAIFAGILTLLLGAAALGLSRTRSRNAKLPPGPPGHWFRGTKIPPLSWRQFYEWSKVYGDVFTLRMGRKLLVVVGGYEAANEIMEKRGAVTMDRPRNIAVGEVLSGGMRVLILREGDKLKRMRRALHAHLQPKTAAEYEPLQVRAARNVLLDTFRAPELFQAHARRYAASVIISVTYGKQMATDVHDPEVVEVEKCVARLTRSLAPGKYAIESYPFLRYIPGYLTELRTWHEEELNLFKGQYRKVAKEISSRENVPPSFAKSMIQSQQELDLSEDEAAYVCGSMFGAGSDTTSGAIMVVGMAAACFPDAQKKAQEHLDSIVGRDRLPSFADSEDLPYVHAFVLETYRWRPISSGGFQHRVTEDFAYKGYIIPKGASIQGNHWAIFRDESVFPDPEDFRPERWLDEHGRLRDDLKNYNFGFGRRVCPGIHVANRSLFINTAMLLWAFAISQDPEAPIDTMAFTNSANSHPLPFKARFRPRFGGVEEILKSANIESY